MYIHHNDFGKNGHEHKGNSDRLIYISPKYQHLFNAKTTPARMELKLWLGVLYGTGLTSYIAAVIFNWGTWKQDILFFVAIMFGFARLGFYVLKQVQLWQLRKLQIKEKQRDLDHDIFS